MEWISIIQAVATLFSAMVVTYVSLKIAKFENKFMDKMDNTFIRKGEFNIQQKYNENEHLRIAREMEVIWRSIEVLRNRNNEE